MRKLRHNTGLWQFLNRTGVLERGDKLEIENAKKEYRKIYLREYKRKHRQARKEYLISYTSEEAKAIQKSASEHRISESQWIKRAAQAYSEQTFLVPDQEVLQKILQLTMLCRSQIAMVSQRDPQSWFSSNRNYKTLQKAIEKMEAEISNTYLKPPLLEEVILQRLKEDHSFCAYLNKLLKNDHQKQG